MKGSQFHCGSVVWNRFLKAKWLAKDTRKAIQSYIQSIHEYAEIFSQFPICATDHLDEISHLLKESASKVEAEVKQLREKEESELVDSIRTERSNCALCIRDGIEKKYGSWDEWQSIAREVLQHNAPEATYKLASYEKVTGKKSEVAK